MKDFFKKRSLLIIVLVSITIVAVFLSVRLYQGTPVTPILDFPTADISAQTPTAEQPLDPEAVAEILIPTPHVFTQPEREEPLDLALGELFEIGEESYLHLSGIFELHPPADWKISEEDENHVSFSSPDESAFVEIYFTTPGPVPDRYAFDRFIAAREGTAFGEFFLLDESIFELESKLEEDDPVIAVSKQLLIDDVGKSVVSFYIKEQESIIAIDFWFTGVRVDASTNEYQALMNGLNLQTHRAAITGFPSNADMTLFTNENFSVDVPVGWAHTNQTNEVSSIDTFTSPDFHAALQIIVFREEEPLWDFEASDFALTLLQEFVTDEVTVTESFTHSRGGEKISWKSVSEQGNYQGITQYFNLNDVLLMTFFLVDESHQDIYQHIFSLTLEKIVISSTE